MSRNTALILDKLRRDILHTLHPLKTFFIEINSVCNLNCKHCYIPSHSRKKTLSFNDISKTIKEVKDTWGNSVGIAITGGEPLLHPHFNEIAEILHHYKFNWSLATNGLLMTSEITDFLLLNSCDSIAISLDGDERSHNTQRKGNDLYKKTLAIIDLLVKKDFPQIYISTTIHDDNIDSLEEISLLLSKYGSNITWRINPLLYCENMVINNLTLSEKTYLKACKFVDQMQKESNITVWFGERNPLALKYKDYLYSDFDSCFAGISTFGILANGDIVNCMVCRNKILDNIKTCKSLKEVWRKEDRKQKGLCSRHFSSKDSSYKKV